MIKLNGKTIDFGVFPNGESYADIDSNKVNTDKSNIIRFKFENDTDIVHLQFVKDFVDEYSYGAPCYLIMPYVPYSRMDRKEEKRLFTLKSFARIINSLNFTRITIEEPHSEVTPALLDRVEVVNKSADLALMAMRDELGLQGTCWLRPAYSYADKEFSYNLEGLLERAKDKGIYLVYPDNGAEKRYTKQIKYSKVMSCSKERDFNTGNIKSIKLQGYEDAQDCEIAIIVDDLCSKGGTFVGSAVELYKYLPNLKKVILCITHSENTIYEGSVLSGEEISKVYTTTSILKEKLMSEEVNFDRSKLVIIDD